jgi:hypothetical protein
MRQIDMAALYILVIMWVLVGACTYAAAVVSGMANRPTLVSEARRAIACVIWWPVIWWMIWKRTR